MTKRKLTNTDVMAIVMWAGYLAGQRQAQANTIWAEAVGDVTIEMGAGEGNNRKIFVFLRGATMTQKQEDMFECVKPCDCKLIK